MELMVRLANRVSLETLLIVVGYTAFFLRVVTFVEWQTQDWGLMVGGAVLLTIVWAVGMYHARLKCCVAEYCGRRPAFPLYCLWPLQSMLLVGGLLVIAGCCATLGLFATLAVVACVTLCLLPSDAAMLVALVVGVLPGCILGFLLAVSVVSKLGPQWLKLT
jgi:hypothetical protein